MDHVESGHGVVIMWWKKWKIVGKSGKIKNTIFLTKKSPFSTIVFFGFSDDTLFQVFAYRG